MYEKGKKIETLNYKLIYEWGGAPLKWSLTLYMLINLDLFNRNPNETSAALQNAVQSLSTLRN